MDENKRSDGVADVSKGSEATEQNIIKKVCKELNLTYKQLGEAIGYSEAAIKAAIAKNEISEPMRRAIELYQETLNLKEQNKEFEAFKAFFKNILKD